MKSLLRLYLKQEESGKSMRSLVFNSSASHILHKLLIKILLPWPQKASAAISNAWQVSSLFLEAGRVWEPAGCNLAQRSADLTQLPRKPSKPRAAQNCLKRAHNYEPLAFQVMFSDKGLCVVQSSHEMALRTRSCRRQMATCYDADFMFGRFLANLNWPK